jgi:hypothetical protein
MWLLAGPAYWAEIIASSAVFICIFGGVLIMGLHLVVLLSLRLRHHSLEVTILLLFLGGCLLALVDQVWRSIALLCMMLAMIPATIAMQPAIGRLIRQRAGE